MIAATTHVQVWIATGAVDMRKSFDSLAEHVRAFLGHDPTSGNLFVFRNRSGERVKILWWDRNGLVLYYKRLERGVFQFPASTDKAMPIDSGQLMRLLQGMKTAGESGGASTRQPRDPA